jgi:hypothetical protein
MRSGRCLNPSQGAAKVLQLGLLLGKQQHADADTVIALTGTSFREQDQVADETMSLLVVCVYI